MGPSVLSDGLFGWIFFILIFFVISFGIGAGIASKLGWHQTNNWDEHMLKNFCIGAPTLVGIFFLLVWSFTQIF